MRRAGRATPIRSRARSATERRPRGRRRSVCASARSRAPRRRMMTHRISDEESIMNIKRTGTAVWSGGFENGPGTNPEELIGAAHAGCFTMALSAQLGEAGMKAKSLQTTATVTLDKVDDGFSISEVHLNLVAVIPGADQAAFEAAALKAKINCPVSKLLNTHVTLDARLEN